MRQCLFQKVRHEQPGGVIAAQLGADGEQRNALRAFKPFLQQAAQAGRPGRAERRGHGR